MKVTVSLCSFVLAIISISSCSKAIVENSAGTAANSSAAQTAENESVRSVSNQSTQTDKRKSSPGPRGEVISAGKDYIKNSGWTVPSGAETDVTERQTDMGTTKDGKAVQVILIFHDYKAPKSYSENFYYEGPNLDNMKGRLRSGGFTKYGANGKIFMYAVFVEKVVPPPASNSDPHEDPFVYQIMDADGDGIFETLLGDYDKIIVPNWVVK